MKDFEFHRPASVKDAVALVAGREGAKFLGGGQSLLPVMKLDQAHGVMGGIVDSRRLDAPPASNRDKFGRCPSSFQGTIGSKVAPSRPTL